MKPEAGRCLELLERRLATLRLLSLDLEESRTVFAHMDLQDIQRHVAHQEDLCAQVRLLDGELKALVVSSAGDSPKKGSSTQLAMPTRELDPTSARQLRLLLSGLSATQADLRRLSRVHSELLRRSRRSINVLLNVLAQYSGTYQHPGDRSFPASSLQVGE